MKYFFIYFSLVVILAAVSMSDASSAEFKWERELAATLIVADWLQTREIAKNPEKFEEKNLRKVIGAHPNTTGVHQYFASKLLIHYLINEYLSKDKAAWFLSKDKAAWYNYITIVGVGGVVSNNYAFGVRVKF